MVYDNNYNFLHEDKLYMIKTVFYYIVIHDLFIQQPTGRLIVVDKSINKQLYLLQLRYSVL